MLDSAFPRHSPTAAQVLSIQVGRPKTYTWLGHEVQTSIYKNRVHGPVRAAGVNLEGDDQADRKQHGGSDKAVYAYAREDQEWWEYELQQSLPFGIFGENLTTRGLDLHAAVVGQTWQIGSAVLQVSEPRTPCWKLGLRMRDSKFPRRFAASRRTGVLLRILSEGTLTAGDPIEVRAAPAHGVTVGTVNRIYYGEDRDVTPLYRATELAAHWREWADHRTVWHLDDERKKGIRVS